ncbi:hypothetical protein [Streptomyces sp. NPDC048191]|uniref:hypothetical protein n=1 Tax=Streptomyces sp. NPDC048191 TaxID=3155484 RepID=UPI0033C45D7D
MGEREPREAGGDGHRRTPGASGRPQPVRYLRYGLLSGLINFLLLYAAGNLLSPGASACLWLASLVVAPALAARRFSARPGTARRRAPLPSAADTPRPVRAAEPGAAQKAAQRAVTSYGELLRLHPYAPGPAADPDDLADFRTALEAYEEARRSTPGRVPELLERGRAALERLETARLAATDVSWTHGTGSAELRLAGPSGDGPALLVFEAAPCAYSVSVPGRSGARRHRLVSGRSLKAPVRARVVVPAPAGGELSVSIHASARWRIAVRPAGEARRLEPELPLNGRGTEVVLRDGHSRGLEFEHHDGGRFAVRLLTSDLRTDHALAGGRGAARLHLAAPGHRAVRIEADGSWTLREPRARAAPGTPKGGHPPRE